MQNSPIAKYQGIVSKGTVITFTLSKVSHETLHNQAAGGLDNFGIAERLTRLHALHKPT
jgi:hypothetical protein